MSPLMSPLPINALYGGQILPPCLNGLGKPCSGGVLPETLARKLWGNGLDTLRVKRISVVGCISI